MPKKLSPTDSPVVKARKMLSLAHHEIRLEIIKRAKKVVGDPRNTCIGFVMCMGSAFFRYSNDRYGPDPRYCNPVYSLIEEFDSDLKLTGNPVRVDLVDGKVIVRRDW